MKNWKFGIALIAAAAILAALMLWNVTTCDGGEVRMGGALVIGRC